jgi:hypothetical protein
LDVTEGLMALAEDDVRYMIIRKNLLDEQALVSWRTALGPLPLYEDTMLLVYSTERSSEKTTADDAGP